MSTQNPSLGSLSATPAKRIETLRAAFAALVVGCGLVYAMGFAHPMFLHNAAHDWRHSMNFPCH